MLGINIADVISVISSIQNYLVALCVVLVLAIVVTVAVLKLQKPLKKLIRKEAWLCFALVVVVIVNMIVMGPMYSMINMVAGDTASGEISAESIASAQELCEEIANEGIVLLKNDNSVLPLANKKVNVFGWSSTNPVYGGTGSGSLSANYPTVSLLDGLKNAGIEYNQDLVDFYTSWRTDRPSVGMMGQDWTIPEPTVEEYGDLFDTALEYSDTAIVVIARSGGEGADLPTSYDGVETYVFDENSWFGATGTRYSDQADDLDASKHYLELSNRERAMLEEVTSRFDKVIVVANAANTMELGFVDEMGIDGLISCPGTGQTGFNGLGNILSGAVNPSAKTADTFVYDLLSTPTANNFGNFVYDNMDEYAVENMFAEGGSACPTFVNYTDSIYVGYKFYETAATEGLIDYEATVQFPFGYGLSYTTFEQTMGELTESNGTISFDVTVTNTGSVAGKDVVEVYYNPPYTNGGVEKASANLVTFAKTSELAPGASETITMSFSTEDMMSYDESGEGGYVLEAGDYVISINSDSHHIIASQVWNNAATAYGRESDEVAATNQFQGYLGEGNGEVTYLSRANGFANYSEAVAAPTSYSMSDELVATYFNNTNWDVNSEIDEADEVPTTGADNGRTLAEYRGLDYDDPAWEELLDQLTIDDMKNLIGTGGYQTVEASSVGKVTAIDCDGPASINNNFTGGASIGFEAAVMIASTWNVDLAQAFGSSIGQMADEMGVSGWYAPAMNTHRSAFAGRNFEYYSEDGVLGGQMAAHAVAGAAEHGVYSFIKHYALNDQETNRTGLICTWATEQSIREIYLKPFETAVKQANAGAVMSAFNNIGTVPAQCHDGLLNVVLRDEWGFRGFVLTDYFGGYGYQNADRYIRHGNDCMLATYDTGFNYITDTTSGTGLQAARLACKNILYTVVNSRSYATDVATSAPGWVTTVHVVDGILVVLFLLLEFFAIKKFLKAKKEEPAVTVE